MIGIGYIKKLEKNKVKWIKDDLGDTTEIEQEKKLAKNIEENTIILENLKNEELKLDLLIQNLNSDFEAIINEEDFKKFGYITHSDLKNLRNYEKNINMIAIKAPVGTSIEITDPKVVESVYQETKHVRNYCNYFLQILLPYFQNFILF